MLEQTREKFSLGHFSRLAILAILLSACEGKNPVAPEDYIHMVVPEVSTISEASTSTANSLATNKLRNHTINSHSEINGEGALAGLGLMLGGISIGCLISRIRGKKKL